MMKIARTVRPQHTARQRCFPSLAVLSILALVAPAAHAQSTVYTSQSDFTTALGANAATAYTETFTGGAGEKSSFSFSGKGYTYKVTTTSISDVYRDGTFIGSGNSDKSLIFTFTSGNVTALGGNFFITNSQDAAVSGTVTLTLDNGTTTTFTGTSASDFRGFTTTSPIKTLTFASPSTDTFIGYSSVDNLTVGTAPAAAPEPSAFAVLAMGLFGLGALTLRARQREAGRWGWNACRYNPHACKSLHPNSSASSF